MIMRYPLNAGTHRLLESTITFECRCCWRGIKETGFASDLSVLIKRLCVFRVNGSNVAAAALRGALNWSKRTKVLLFVAAVLIATTK